MEVSAIESVSLGSEDSFKVTIASIEYARHAEKVSCNWKLQAVFKCVG